MSKIKPSSQQHYSLRIRTTGAFHFYTEEWMQRAEKKVKNKTAVRFAQVV